MTLHVFNPEHDIALAAGLACFTAPHAGRMLRHDLGFLPALWASADDAILTDDAVFARRAVARRQVACRHFVERKDLQRLKPDRIEPWGWDAALKAFLLRNGIDSHLLPGDEALKAIRQLSHRRLSAKLLPMLQREGTVGEALECRSAAEAGPLIGRWGEVVLKAPWSSSGRGLRFVSNSQLLFEAPLDGWLRNVVTTQGCVMAEPSYCKVKDFGMEFMAHADGHVSYEGLSLFHTVNGAYTGNIIATEAAKRILLSRYLDPSLTDEVCADVCRLLPGLLDGRYQGPLGIDMMVVAGKDGFLLHPCVEVNLRRTMGHAALALSPTDDDERRVMRIVLDNRYKLKINKL